MSAFEAAKDSSLRTWQARLVSHEPVDQAAAEAAIGAWFDLAKMRLPRLVFVAGSPLEAAACWAVQSREDESRLRPLLHALEYELSTTRPPSGRPPLLDESQREFAAWHTGLRGVSHNPQLGLRGERTGAMASVALRDVSRLPQLAAAGRFDPSRFLTTLALDTRWTPEQVLRHPRLRRPVAGPAFDLQLSVGLCAYLETLASLGVPLDGRAPVLLELGRACPMVWLLPHMGIVAERPVHRSLDEDGLLHCADGPAVRFPDGYCCYAWHGLVVDRRIIDPGLSVAEIAEWPNAEERRCAIERLGWNEFLAQSTDAIVGAAVPDPGNPGCVLELRRVSARSAGWRSQVLVCTNGTPSPDGTRRRYALWVPSYFDDPLEAAAWTYGLSRDDYAQAMRRA